MMTNSAAALALPPHGFLSPDLFSNDDILILRPSFVPSSFQSDIDDDEEEEEDEYDDYGESDDSEETDDSDEDEGDDVDDIVENLWMNMRRTVIKTLDDYDDGDNEEEY
jgi:hypothetical protein